MTLLLRQPLRGHGTASILESIWMKSGRMQLPRTLLRGVISILVVALGAAGQRAQELDERGVEGKGPEAGDRRDRLGFGRDDCVPHGFAHRGPDSVRVNG